MSFCMVGLYVQGLNNTCIWNDIFEPFYSQVLVIRSQRLQGSSYLNGLGGSMLKRVFSSIFLILFRPPETVFAFIFLVLLWSVGNSMSPGRSGMEKRLPFFSWILGMWGPPFFFSCTILLRSSLKTGHMEKQRVGDSSLSKLMSMSGFFLLYVYKDSDFTHQKCWFWQSLIGVYYFEVCRQLWKWRCSQNFDHWPPWSEKWNLYFKRTESLTCGPSQVIVWSNETSTEHPPTKKDIS